MVQSAVRSARLRADLPGHAGRHAASRLARTWRGSGQHRGRFAQTDRGSRMTATELLDYAQTLNRRGERYAKVTVVRVTPPTSAYVGAQAIVLADGTLRGSVGGGCSKQVVADAALEAMQSGIAKLVRISNAAPGPLEHGVEQRAMRCA